MRTPAPAPPGAGKCDTVSCLPARGTRPGHARRRRLLGGIGLFGTLLGLTLFAQMVLLGVGLLDDWLDQRRTAAAIEQLATLSRAASTHGRDEFVALIASTAGPPVEIDIDDLDAVLPPSFDRDGDALRRPHRLLARRGAGGGVEIMVLSAAPAGATVPRPAALLGAPGDVRIGLVTPPPDTPAAPSRLLGPAIDVDVAAWRAAFGGDPRDGSLATVVLLTQAIVCGDALLRQTTAACPDGQTMEAPLDLAGNDLVNAGAISAESLAVSGNLEVAGDLEVATELIVGTLVAADEPFDFSAGDIRADTVQTGELVASSVDVTGDLDAESAVIGQLTVGQCTGC